MGPTRNMCEGVYRVPRVRYDVGSALTNTSPTGAFRGAGRPEATALIERMMDIAAAELDIDPVEIRRANFIQPDEFPYTTSTGMLYDSGDYDLVLSEAVRRSDYVGLRAEQAARRERGDRLQLGIGVAVYVEITAGGPGGEFGSVEVHTDGTATIRVGTTATGQGHATSFSMLVADRLGIALERIHFIQADTAEVPRGGGTVGSRSLQLGGVAVAGAADQLVERARRLAADLLEADAADIVVSDEGVGVAGVPTRAIGWGELAVEAAARGKPLAESADFVSPGATFPFGAHVSVVEVDIETGKVRPVRHIAVDDAGSIVNPLLVRGQQHGGLAQGISQALWEEVRYDADGNPQTGNFASYCIPSAAEVCFYEASNTETPTPHNLLGAKGIGESATVGSTPAVQNAVVDAVSHLGVRHLDMPCTPERIWRAIEAARHGELPELWQEPPGIFATFADRASPRAGANEATH
jgi:carbon-monoxide dehydrogenase large subunit